MKYIKSTIIVFLAIAVMALILEIPKARASVTINSGFSAPPSNVGLVGYWTMDGKDINWKTGTVSDRSGNGNNGTATNMSTTTSPAIGKIGQALSFDGVNDYINLGSPKVGSATRGLTVSSWVYTGNGIFDNGVQTIAADNTGNPNVENGFFFGLDDRGGATAPINGVHMIVDTVTGLERNEMASNVIGSLPAWYYIVGTYDPAAGDMKIYVNGAEVSTSVVTAGSGNYIPDTNQNLYLGALDNGTVLLNGKLDEFRIYNRALSAAEIATLYQSGVAKFNASPSNTLTSGLVGYWTMDGKDINWKTGTVSDRSGNGNNGTATNMSTTTSPAIGKIGQALSFDGVNDFVNVPYNSSLNPTNAITLSAWVKTTSTARGDIIARFNPNSPFPGYGLILAPNYGCGTAGQVAMWVGDNTSKYVCSTTTVNDGRWHHIAGTYDGTTARVYIDGSQATSGVRTNGLNQTSIALTVGYCCSTAPSYYTGSIDEPRIYNRALSAAEIATLYQSGVAKFNASPSNTLTSGLVGYWTMDGKDINWKTGTVSDRSGNGNNGTATNMSTTTSPAIGKIGQALSFNAGSSQYVDIGTAASPAANSFSISFWEKSNKNNSGSYRFWSFISNRQNNAAFTGLLLTQSIDTGKLRFQLNDSSNTHQYVVGNGNVSNGLLHHIVLSVNRSTNLASLYVDSVIDVANVDISAVNGSILSTSALQIAQDSAFCSTDSVACHFTGLIDEVRIYNRALSATEVLQLYNAGR